MRLEKRLPLECSHSDRGLKKPGLVAKFRADAGRHLAEPPTLRLLTPNYKPAAEGLPKFWSDGTKIPAQNVGLTRYDVYGNIAR
jgi:hypothetical protein